MENKYLPIGTICTIKNNNKKIMIISYFSIEYNNNVVMYDYKGCVYPEGLLLPAQVISFNHDDIVSIDYMGYKNEQYDVFNSNLNREKDAKEYESKPILTNFLFDENGVVIFDPTVPEDTSMVKTVEQDTTNPFKVETRNNVSTEQKNNIFDKYKFDENGVVISDETVLEQPRYTFDENGFVISDSTSEMNSQESTSENEPVLEQPRYTFDENGVVISDSTGEMNSQESTSGNEPITNDELSLKRPKYAFDENGIVISDSTSEENN